MQPPIKKEKKKFTFFAGINFHQWRCSAFFAGFYFRDFAVKRELTKVSSFKVLDMTPWSLRRTAVTPDTVKIMKINSCKSLKFSTKLYTKLCILVDPFLRNCVTKSNFQYFYKKKKKALALEGLTLLNLLNKRDLLTYIAES